MKNNFKVMGDVVIIFIKRRNGEFLETKISVSDLDKAKLFPYTWIAIKDSNSSRFYVSGNMMQPDGSQKTIKLHRWLMDCPVGMVVDHINHDSLDNRRENLRVVEHWLNCHNRDGIDAHNTSGFHGVHFRKDVKRWYGYVDFKGTRHHVGIFDTKEEAAKSVKERKQILFTEVQN